MRGIPLLCGAGLMLLGGCSPPLAIQIPINRMDTPQTQGVRRVALDLGPKGASRIEFIDNVALYESDPPDQAIFSNGSGGIVAMGANARVGLAKRIDVGTDLTSSNFVDSVWNGEFRNWAGLVKVKLQPFGPTLADDPVGKFSLAVTLGLGGGKAHSGESTTHKRYRSHVSTKMYDAALIAGGYPTESLQLYGGIFATRGTYDGYFSYKRDGVLIDEYEFDGNIRSVGWNFGMDIVKSRTVHFIIEYAHANVEVDDLTNAADRVGLMTTLMFR